MRSISQESIVCGEWKLGTYKEGELVDISGVTYVVAPCESIPCSACAIRFVPFKYRVLGCQYRMQDNRNNSLGVYPIEEAL